MTTSRGWRRWPGAADGPVESWFVEWLETEARRAMIRAWSPVLCPGLLQTGEYARALLLAGADR